MKMIEMYDLPDAIRNTDEFDNCNKFGAYSSEGEKNEYDRAFEQLIRGTLRLVGNGCWYIEFTDEEYTWFLMRFS